MSSLTEAELIDMGLVSLAETFGLPAESIRRDLFASRAINWGNDPFARGAYSDATPKTREALAVLRPVRTWGLPRRRWPAVGRRRKQRPRLASNCRPDPPDPRVDRPLRNFFGELLTATSLAVWWKSPAESVYRADRRPPTSLVPQSRRLRPEGPRVRILFPPAMSHANSPCS